MKMRSILGMAMFAAILGMNRSDLDNKKVRGKISKIRTSSRTILTPKQKKVRAKNKAAKQSRKLNR